CVDRGDLQKREGQGGKIAGGQILFDCRGADVHSVGPAGGREVTPVATRIFRRGEFHEFEAGRSRFVYIVPAGAIVELDPAAVLVLDGLANGERSLEELVEDLGGIGLTSKDATELLGELAQTRAIVVGDASAESPQNPPAEFPLQTLVLNLTNQCNL